MTGKELLLTLFVSLPCAAISLWLAIKILDRANSRNKLGVSFFINAVFTVLITVFNLAVGGDAASAGPFLLIGGVLLLFMIVSVLTRFYDLGLFKGFAVLIVWIALNLAMSMAAFFALAAMGAV